MAKIIKTEVCEMPAVKLIGRRYSEKDWGENGTFSQLWCEWFESCRFDELRVCEGLKGISDDYVGAMRCRGNSFEYWIGMLMAPGDAAPEGFEGELIEGGKLFVGYIYGNEQSGELYGEDATARCRRMLELAGFTPKKGGWTIERYNCPRYTDPDAEGNVILDYCVQLEG